MFAPQLKKESSDIVVATLAKIARGSLVATIGLLPLLFIPVSYAPFAYSKILIVIVGVAISLIFYCLAALREGSIVIRFSSGLVAIWSVAGAGVVAALLSGDMRDAFFGDVLNVHTVSFLILLALLASAISILSEHKASILRLYAVLAVSGLVVALYQIIRVAFGEGFLSLGVFTSLTSSPIGSWNDLALFFGLVILMLLVTLEQFPLTKWGKAAFGVTAVIALAILGLVNFFLIWIVLGLASLIVLMYALTKNRFSDQTISAVSNTQTSIMISALVFVVSAVFIVGGPALGQVISDASGISYVEVRPSLSATFDIARSVYQENAFTGIGPNKFADAWRLYKDPTINITNFWSANFVAGIGYVTTFAVTMGLFGVIAWVTFLGTMVYSGFRFVFLSSHTDRFWQYIGISSFVASLYLWGMSIVYVPGVTLILLAGCFTGLLLVAYGQVVHTKSLTISISQNKQAGFVLVAIAMLVIVSSVATVFFVSRHYASVFSFNAAVASVADGVPIETIERKIAAAYELSPNDWMAREIAGIQLTKVNQLITLSEPTDQQRQQLEEAIVNAVNAAQRAVQTDPSDASNWILLANVFIVLTGSNIDGAYTRAIESLDQAESLDPVNPEIKLLRARAESFNGNLDAAKELALRAVSLKRNYTPALLFLTQLDIARGDVAGAIASVQATITFEPRNPARYYQLGVLYSAQEDVRRATEAFETAVSLDKEYANARYFLALAYSEAGRTDDAIAQLEVVRSLNPNNEVVSSLIEQLRSGTLPDTTTDTTSEDLVDSDVTVQEDGDVTTSSDPASPLLTPVNVIPATTNQSETDTNNEAGQNSNE